jgi:hypothetical protein
MILEAAPQTNIHSGIHKWKHLFSFYATSGNDLQYTLTLR